MASTRVATLIGRVQTAAIHHLRGTPGGATVGVTVCTSSGFTWLAQLTNASGRATHGTFRGAGNSAEAALTDLLRQLRAQPGNVVPLPARRRRSSAG